MKGGEILKYCKLIASGLLCLGFATMGDSKIKADYFTDYNTTVTDTILEKVYLILIFSITIETILFLK